MKQLLRWLFGPGVLIKKERFEEVAARAVWDYQAGDCSEDCRWGITPINECWCQEEAHSIAQAICDAIERAKS